MQACKLSGGSRVLATELAPQILPLFSYDTARRYDFGSSLPSPRHSPVSNAASSALAGTADETAFWDLVYVLYPEVAEALSVGTTHQLVPSWRPLEAGLEVSDAFKANPANAAESCRLMMQSDLEV